MTSQAVTHHSSPLSTSCEWSFELLERYDQEISKIAAEFGLDTYPNQIEVIASEQMLDGYSSVGMPIGYHHWSFGKQFVNAEKHYKHGFMGLAYEIVINSKPCIAYLMEENSIVMQATVIAHACYGHNSFFKNNYLFKTWTHAESIIDYLVFAKNYIAECEERNGIDAVEDILDASHALMHFGVDRYKRPSKISLHDEQIRQNKREEYLQSQVNDLWRTLPKSGHHTEPKRAKRFPEEPQENLLYFFEKHAPMLEPWQREIIRIVRKLAQYFYPQRQTQVMNEGWACFWHYTIINELYDRGLVNNDFMLEFIQNHTTVIYQPPFDHKQYSGLNPYTLGLGIYSDIRRMCENPTEEDKHWFPEIAGSNWVEAVDFAMRNFKDESFIAQYLSPKLIRDLHLFSVMDDDEQDFLYISGIHNEDSYQEIRECLSKQYNLASNEPNIQIYSADIRGSRALTLRYFQNERRPLDKSADEVMRYVYRLWGFPVRLETINEQGEVISSFQCPPEPLT